MVEAVFNNTQTVVIYRKSDGKIVRVSALSPHLIGKISESDLPKLMHGTDVKEMAMIVVQGKQYLDIEKYKVEVDVNGAYVDLVEKADVLTSFEKTADVTPDLLDRDVGIVISVLGVIDDKERLAKYKELELSGQNRLELVNFFKQRGV